MAVAMRSSTNASADASAEVPRSTTTKSGPLNPAPNPLASRSYARRCVVLTGSVPASAWPSRISSIGTARSSNTKVAVIADRQG